MKHMIKLVALAAALSAQAASAATFNLSLRADDGSRWYEYGSDAYAELGTEHPNGGDGFYFIGLTDPADAGKPLGTGVEVFPNANNFLNIGSVTYDNVSGNVTGLTLDFDNYIADDDAVVNTGYTTTLSGVSGSVVRAGAGGAVSAINLTSNITFTYVTGFGNFAYTGTLAFNGTTFVLDVDDTLTTPLGESRYRWDVTGGIQGLAAPVPEPSTYALMMAGLLTVGAIARRRRSI